MVNDDSNIVLRGIANSFVYFLLAQTFSTDAKVHYVSRIAPLIGEGAQRSYESPAPNSAAFTF